MITTEYDDELDIDLLGLDHEVRDQPRRFMKYSQLLADRRDAMERANERVDVERAEADRRARQKLSVGAEKKPTEAMVQAEVITDAVYKQAMEKYLDLKHEVDILQGVVKAFDQRKDMIEGAIRLHGQNYFSGPQVPNDPTQPRRQRVSEEQKAVGRDRAAQATSGRTR